MEITLIDLPKVSTNKIYAGVHWVERKKMKDAYIFIIKNQFKDVLSKQKTYIVNYIFTFKNKPLDAMNCTFMAKMIEDIIFEDDKHDIIMHVGISSRKGKEDVVHIEIKNDLSNDADYLEGTGKISTDSKIKYLG